MSVETTEVAKRITVAGGGGFGLNIGIAKAQADVGTEKVSIERIVNKETYIKRVSHIARGDINKPYDNLLHDISDSTSTFLVKGKLRLISSKVYFRELNSRYNLDMEFDPFNVLDQLNELHTNGLFEYEPIESTISKRIDSSDFRDIYRDEKKYDPIMSFVLETKKALFIVNMSLSKCKANAGYSVLYMVERAIEENDLSSIGLITKVNSTLYHFKPLAVWASIVHR